MNPHQHSLPVTFNVDVPDGETFILSKLHANGYYLSLLGGQHITMCDIRLLNSVYNNFKTDLIPKSITFKQAFMFQGLTANEESFVVKVLNDRANLGNIPFDMVRKT